MSKVMKTNGSDVESDNVSAHDDLALQTVHCSLYSPQESRISTNASETSTQRGSTKGGRRKSKGKPSNNNKPVKSLYRFNCFLNEENAKQIFAVQFNHFVKDRNIFATASGYRISVYECVEPKEEDEGIEEDDDFCGIKLLRAYDDPDRDEVFYTLAWSFEANGSPIIACGGVRSICRIIYCNGPGLREKKFIGHSELSHLIVNQLSRNYFPFQPTQSTN